MEMLQNVPSHNVKESENKSPGSTPKKINFFPDPYFILLPIFMEIHPLDFA